ncbi:7160_t:CDS:1, partial [Ambispora leptoticha]
KDFSHITSAQKVWPQARVQLCYWHIFHAIKKKLSSTGIIYPAYNAYEAHVTCTIIDPTWQPKPRNQQVLSELSPTNLPDNPSVVDLNKYKVFCRKDQREHIIQL